MSDSVFSGRSQVLSKRNRPPRARGRRQPSHETLEYVGTAVVAAAVCGFVLAASAAVPASDGMIAGSLAVVSYSGVDQEIARPEGESAAVSEAQTRDFDLDEALSQGIASARAAAEADGDNYDALVAQAAANLDSWRAVDVAQLWAESTDLDDEE